MGSHIPLCPLGSATSELDILTKRTRHSLLGAERVADTWRIQKAVAGEVKLRKEQESAGTKHSNFPEGRPLTHRIPRGGAEDLSGIGQASSTLSSGGVERKGSVTASCRIGAPVEMWGGSEVRDEMR